MLKWIYCVMALMLGGLAAAHAASEAVVTTTNGRFDDVSQSLVAAIEGKGLVIAHTSRVGEMLDRTGKDIGASRRVYEQTETYEFCSARVSRMMMEADASNIVYCPFAITVYTLPGKPNAVYLAYRRPPAAVPAVGELIKSIVADAMELAR